MNADGRSTSEQLFIPNLLVVGAGEKLFAQCRIAANTYGLQIRICSLRDATDTVVRRRPLAIVVPDDLLDEIEARELEAFARDVRSVLLRLDPDVSVREIEAMIGGAVAGGLDERERLAEAGRYSMVQGVEEEEPFSRRTWPPPSVRVSAPPPSARSASPPPSSVSPHSSRTAPPSSVSPQTPRVTQPSMRTTQPPQTARTLPPASAAPRSTLPPQSARLTPPPPPQSRATLPPSSARVPPPPQSMRNTVPPQSAAPQSAQAAPASQSPRSTSPPSSVSPGLAKARVAQPPPLPQAQDPAAAAGEPPPASGPQSRPGGMFAAIRAVFTSK
jgi:hypothetical protein